MPVVRIVDLHKSFGALAVLKGISIDIEQGSTVSVIGASGSGKSTLLRCINLLEEPTSGSIYITGRPLGFMVDANGNRKRASERSIREIRRDIGMVFQQFNLWPHMTVMQNVLEAPRLLQRKPRGELESTATLYLEKVGLLDKRNEYPARLSGGQQQRVAIARALAMEPKLMLFDEPTSSLDPELTGEVLLVMQRLAEEGMTMVIVTHEMEFAREVSSRVIFVDEGRVGDDGPPAQVFSDTASARCQRFLHRALRRPDQEAG
jgi:ABC-type histidine transport system ATPase subunit